MKVFGVILGVFVTVVGCLPAIASSVPITNPSGEINSQVDGTAIPHPAFLGWTGANGQTLRGKTHGGNGAWRISLNAGGHLQQVSSHIIATGQAFSLRFDAATFAGLPTSVVAEFFTEPSPGTVNVILAKTFNFTTPLTAGSWEGFQLLTAFGEFDAYAGGALGVRFRNPSATSNSFLSVDNIRLERFAAAASSVTFAKSWLSTPDRPWAGSDFWVNRLQDWEVSAGSLQTRLGAAARPRRTAHQLTTGIREEPGDFLLSVRTRLVSGSTWDTGALTGIFVGTGARHDYRGAALMHHTGGRDGGIFVGVNAAGRAVIHDHRVQAFPQRAIGNIPALLPTSFRVEVSATWRAGTHDYLLTALVRDGATDSIVSQTSYAVEAYAVLGNFGLFSHPGSGTSRFSFQDFSGVGTKLQSYPERAFGPVLATQYTLGRGVLKLTAQLAPVSLVGAPPLALEINPGAGWQTVATAVIDVDAYTGTFRVPNWTYTSAVPFRVGYAEAGATAYRTGTIQADPVGKREIVVAGLTCVIHCAADAANDGFNGIDEAASGPVSWSRDRINFPHQDITRHLPLHEPDLYAFTGDQVYEGGSPTGQDSSSDENRRLDYLYKWYLFCWTWRDVLADRPSINLPDDHDVFQGNLWGEGGKATTDQENGGYVKPAAFVKMVERTQTSHLPDPFDPTAIMQNIGVYYTNWTYGRIGFAIFEDRKFKNGYADEGFGTIGDKDPASNTTRFNRTNLQLLGARQETFLEAFAADWTGQDMKAAISQSPFASAGTHVGPSYIRIYFDLDANGWPQNKRDRSVGLLRKSFSPHINGDQHVSILLQHGISSDRDAVYSFCVPPIANAFSRAWDPADTTSGATTVVSPYTGPFRDGFGNRINVLAVGNPAHYYGQTTFQGTELLHDRGPGYGIIRFDKLERTTTFECWPLYADPTNPASGSQYPGWPVTIRQTDNDGRTPVGYLPVIDTGNLDNPVVRIYDQGSGELVYGYRVRGSRFRAPVYAASQSYRTEVVTADGETPLITSGLLAGPMPAHAVFFEASSRYLVRGQSLRLRWDSPAATTLTITPGIGTVTAATLHGIGYVEVSPTADTTWTLTSTSDAGETLQAQANVRVFPAKTEWRTAFFSSADLADQAKESTLWGDDADPDQDGISNGAEHSVQTSPIMSDQRNVLSTGIAGIVVSAATGQYPVHTIRELLPASGYEYVAQSSDDLQTWTPVPWNQLVEVSRETSAGQTDRVSYRFSESITQSATTTPRRFHRMLLRRVSP